MMVLGVANMEVFNNGPAPLISALCRALGITHAIDWLTVRDERQCNLSPGLLVEAIINLLASCKPLYLIHEYFHHGMQLPCLAPVSRPATSTTMRWPAPWTDWPGPGPAWSMAPSP
jgi:hypothetical protein